VALANGQVFTFQFYFNNLFLDYLSEEERKKFLFRSVSIQRVGSFVSGIYPLGQDLLICTENPKILKDSTYIYFHLPNLVYFANTQDGVCLGWSSDYALHAGRMPDIGEFITKENVFEGQSIVRFGYLKEVDRIVVAMLKDYSDEDEGPKG